MNTIILEEDLGVYEQETDVNKEPEYKPNGFLERLFDWLMGSDGIYNMCYYLYLSFNLWRWCDDLL
ncbi:UNVERIFIED_ORG: tRNA nucleotidyltransferase [Escherichia phage CMSTMSU]